MHANTLGGSLRVKLALGVLAVSVGLLPLSGCSNDQDPLNPELSQEPEFGYELSGGQASPTAYLPSGFQAVEVEESFTPSKGGELSSGRFTLTVPPWATDRRETFAMKYNPYGPVQVELYPHGAKFNEDAPVELRIDLHWTTLARYDDVTLYWYDEEHEKWVDVGGDWDPKQKILTTKLAHFSIFCPGRAGW